jgi:hypothetical protein
VTIGMHESRPLNFDHMVAERPEGQSAAFACHESFLASYGWIKQDGTPTKGTAG